MKPNVPPDVVIEKGVPLPESPNRGRREKTWADLLGSMEIGDSFVVAYGVGRAIGSYLKKIESPLRVTTSTINVPRNFVRVWRMADADVADPALPMTDSYEAAYDTTIRREER